MKYLKIKMCRYQGNTGIASEIDTYINLQAITYIDVTDIDNKVFVRFQGDVNVYYITDKDTINKLINAIK